MAFKISDTARAQSAARASTGGGYLSPSKVRSGESVRFHIIDADPLEYFTVWGQSEEGQLKPFRFVQDPTISEIEAELGDFTRRMNRDETAPEPPKFAISFAVYDYGVSKAGAIKVCEFSQKSLIRELDKISQEEDYSDFNDWDFKLGKEGQGLTTEYTLLPVPCQDAAAATEAYKNAVKQGFDIKRLLDGGNPFKAD